MLRRVREQVCSIGLAVLLLVGRLVWISGLPVIGEGTTLGAVFTLFYGLIRAFMTTTSRSGSWRWPWGS